ncbi:hypothetical protein ENUP19_0038G0018 [Entamoeba nuttalli]|uniref:tRNA (adenine(58)-N(1))-methyltransferase n=2 Tax=Entamoeba nuttalli TaxID=412467 RepID=A0ABQ0D9L9_9EUKA
MMKQQKEEKYPKYVESYYDIKKSYDTVNHEWVIESLKYFNVEGVIINIIESMMTRWKIFIGYKFNEYLGNIKLNRGILQGDSLSNLLFIIQMNIISQIIEEKFPKANHTLYMDEMRIMTESSEEMGIINNEIIDRPIHQKMEVRWNESKGVDKTTTVKVRNSINIKKNAFLQLTKMQDGAIFCVYRKAKIMKNERLKYCTLCKDKIAITISPVLSYFDITPNSIIVESGTGSGCLSAAFGSRLQFGNEQGKGHLYTFEFHEQRKIKAEEDFKMLGLDKVITVVLRDVVQNGFLVEGLLHEQEADCVFLDLPNVYEAITHAYNVLRVGGKICCFCPCIEQIQKSCQELRKDGRFTNLLTKENVIRPYSIKGVGKRSDDCMSSEILCCPTKTIKGHVGYVTFAIKAK